MRPRGEEEHRQVPGGNSHQLNGSVNTFMQKKPNRLSQKASELSELPFVTDAQIQEFFGQRVSQALSFLDRFSAEQGICSSCGGRCCQEIKCELYLEDFQGCPIYDRRPLICRFHYCQRFGDEHKPLILGLCDSCVDVINGLPAGSPAWRGIELNLDLYGVCQRPENPPPKLVLEMRKVMEATRLKRLGLAEARSILLSMIAIAEEEATS